MPEAFQLLRTFIVLFLTHFKILTFLIVSTFINVSPGEQLSVHFKRQLLVHILNFLKFFPKTELTNEGFELTNNRKVEAKNFLRTRTTMQKIFFSAYSSSLTGIEMVTLVPAGCGFSSEACFISNRSSVNTSIL